MRTRLQQHLVSLPDLSFFPESVLIEEAFDAPVVFGQRNRERIARLLETADLSLVDFEDAEELIRQSLQDEDPWRRYWALVAASSHGFAAESLVDQALRMVEEDPERLVRVRAAEFLGLIEAQEPVASIMVELRACEDPIEAALILNAIVMLRDGEPGYDFEIRSSDIREEIRTANSVQRRLEYLSGELARNDD